MFIVLAILCVLWIPVCSASRGGGSLYVGLHPNFIPIYKSYLVCGGVDNVTTCNEYSGFMCFDRKKIVDISSVNDHYCDCEDCSDELGTFAYSRGSRGSTYDPSRKFYCQNKGFRPKEIFHSQINDMQVDCCDMSDEYLFTVEELKKWGRVRSCDELRKEEEDIERDLREKTEKGDKIRQEHALLSHCINQKLTTIKNQVENLSKNMDLKGKTGDPVLFLESLLSGLNHENLNDTISLFQEYKEHKTKEKNPLHKMVGTIKKYACSAQTYMRYLLYGNPKSNIFNLESIDENSVHTLDDILSTLKQNMIDKGTLDKLSKKINTLESIDFAIANDNVQYTVLYNRRLPPFEYMENIYDISLFTDAYQIAHDKEILVGHYDRTIEYIEEGKKRTKLLYNGGERCWNGQHRQLEIELSCGTEIKVLRISEQKMCQYKAWIELPFVCNNITRADEVGKKDAVHKDL